jgi:class 3 adenylate cyclase
MFCDVVGSTALSTRHDPEDLRELIGDHHRAVAETVGGLTGFVAKYMGDGVLIYFGYPQAHEDDAERAVGAALAVIEAVGRLPAREDLRVRLGLAVVGDLIGEGAAQERGVVGETPNLAARLQTLATPNTLGSAKRPAARSASCLIWKTSGRNNLPVLPIRNAPGGCWAKAAS